MTRAKLGGGLRLIVAATPIDRAGLMRIAGPASAIASRSTVPGCRAVLLAADGRIGLDVETLARVALNATADDAWLTPGERRVVAVAADPVLELACRWVLKEAYGKALGVGLALPLDALGFAGRGGAIVLAGDTAPAADAGWRFALYAHGDRLFGVAQGPPADQAMPLAPAGRKPPTPLPER